MALLSIEKRLDSTQAIKKISFHSKGEKIEAYFVTVQELLTAATTIWWVKGIGMIAVFWILMQLLPNDWAGGVLFERKGFWISSSISALAIFLIFVVPYITWMLLVGLLGTAALIVLAVWAYSSW